VPTAALVAGLALAWRARWYESAFVLGLGTVVKWTPALAFAALLLWLLRRRSFSRAGTYLAGFAIPILLVNVPLLLWRPSEVIHAYTTARPPLARAPRFAGSSRALRISEEPSVENDVLPRPVIWIPVGQARQLEDRPAHR